MFQNITYFLAQKWKRLFLSGGGGVYMSFTRKNLEYVTSGKGAESPQHKNKNFDKKWLLLRKVTISQINQLHFWFCPFCRKFRRNCCPSKLTNFYRYFHRDSEQLLQKYLLKYINSSQDIVHIHCIRRELGLKCS